MNIAQVLADPARLIEHETNRLIGLLGEHAEQTSPSYDDMARRASKCNVPIERLYELHYLHQQGRLAPKEIPLSDKKRKQIEERYHQYIEPLDPENSDINRTDLEEHARQIDCSVRTIERWIERYQIGGLVALASGYNPTKKRQVEPPADLGALNEANLEIAYKRREMLGELAMLSSVKNDMVSQRAEQVGVSARTLRSYWSNYREYGMRGLVPQRRNDHGSRHKISEQVREIIVGLRLSKKDATIKWVHGEACQRARALGEVTPSEWQVRDIINNIPKATLLKADARESEFRNEARITYRMMFDSVVYQIDHNLLDILVQDGRSKKYRKSKDKNAGVRPWCTAIVEAKSRMIVSIRLGYDTPNSWVIAEVLREGLLEYGIPEEVWVDQGKDFISNHIKHVAEDVGFRLKILPPASPQQKGRVERFFGTLNTELLANLDGYVNSNVSKRNPSARPIMTIYELQDILINYAHHYNTERINVHKLTPAAYWKGNIWTNPVNPRTLDLLIQVRATRKVQKMGINYAKGQYWHSELALYVGQEVVIRADSSAVGPPDTIEVYYKGKWICTAFEQYSPRGQEVSPHEISKAQKSQLAHIRKEINKGKKLVRETAPTTDRKDKELSEKKRKEKLQKESEPTSEAGSIELADKHEAQEPNEDDVLRLYHHKNSTAS